jgi:hypothetical protein
VVPVEEGRLLASLIPDSRLVVLDSANHIHIQRNVHAFGATPRNAARTTGQAADNGSMTSK